MYKSLPANYMYYKTIAHEHEQITLLPPYTTCILKWRYHLTEQKDSSDFDTVFVLWTVEYDIIFTVKWAMQAYWNMLHEWGERWMPKNNLVLFWTKVGTDVVIRSDCFRITKCDVWTYTTRKCKYIVFIKHTMLI